MPQKKKATAIVPAYNEEDKIGNVLIILKKCKLIDQIIVVDDGSSDKTAAIARKRQVELIRHRQNKGKSEAVRSALAKARNEVIFLCDADLVDLTPEICNEVIRPVLYNRAVMSIAMRDYGPLMNFVAKFFPSISGERAIKKSVLEKCTHSKYFYGYGMELVINYYCTSKKLAIIKRPFSYEHTFLTEKRGFVEGLIGYLKQAILLVKITLAIKLLGWH